MARTEIDHIDVSLVDRCLSIDLEVDPGQAKIFAFAAVRNQDEKKVVFRNGNREAALDRLEQLAGEADFLLGHNIIRFDLPHLAAVRPRLAGLAAKPIDTLWLNPLAFPRNPYHHLVKHHHDGRLQAGHVNDRNSTRAFCSRCSPTRSQLAAANGVIALAANRMKAGHDIVVNRARARAPEGGVLARLDPVARGRVQLLHTAPGLEAQASAAVDELVRLSQLIPDWSWSGVAIIAREWRFLEPVYSYCEARGIPVQLASETMPPFWRLREIRTFLSFIEAEPTKMLTAETMQAFISSQPANRWWTLLADAIATLGTDLGGKAAPVVDIIELLAEWTRDTRQRQHGLLLLTAHRAKGLEFDDVVILDGSWDRVSKDEDRDAPRRLFYVAMTRAKRSLAIVSMQDRHSILLDAGTSLLQRSIVANDAARGDCSLQYQTADPQSVDLSWVGRQVASHPAHQAIMQIRTGDPIDLVEDNGRWLLRNREGTVIGRMARSYRPPDGLRFIRGEAAAIIRWRKIDNEEEFYNRLRRDAWEVVLPELVFGP